MSEGDSNLVKRPIRHPRGMEELGVGETVFFISPDGNVSGEDRYECIVTRHPVEDDSTVALRGHDQSFPAEFVLCRWDDSRLYVWG